MALLDDKMCEALSPGYALANLQRGGPRLSPKAAALMFEAILENDNFQRRYKIYDPFCGNGILLATLQIGYWDWISWLYGSDANRDSVEITKRNLDMINAPGAIERRIDYLEQYCIICGNTKMKRVESARKIKSILCEKRDLPRYKIFNANALRKEDVDEIGKVDVIITDPPYSRYSLWVDENGERVRENLLDNFLKIARGLLGNDSRLGLIFDREFKFELGDFSLVRKIPIKRRLGYLLVPKTI